MATETPPLLIERRDAIEIVTLNRAETLNAVDIEMAQALYDYFSGTHSRRDVRVIVLRAEGRAFSAGADLNSAAFVKPGPGRPQKQHEIQLLYSGIPRLMRSCPQPIISLINGPACGAGFSLALASDIRILAPEAKMNAAYLKIGVGGCDMGAGYFLPRLVGLSLASELLLTGRFIKADRALALGLANEVVPQEKLLEAGLAFAGDMLKAAPMGLRMTKETLNLHAQIGSLEAGLALEDRQQVILLETADHREAVAAFKEKRSPNYTDT